MPTSILVAALLGALVAGPPISGVTPHTLVVERSGKSLTYQFRGERLDPTRVLSGVLDRMPPGSGAGHSLFILLGEGVPAEQAFTLGSLFRTKASFEAIRYFAFSRRTSIMMEIHLDWQRWKLSLDGNLEAAPL